MISNLSLFFKKYFVPVIFIIIGLAILFIGLSNSQDAIFMFSAFLMIAAGGVSILYSMGKLKPIIVTSIGAVLGVVALVALYLSYDTVTVTIKYNNDSKFCFEKAKQNLQDVSYIQKAYKEKTGVYLGTWEELVDYAKNGTVASYISEGVVPTGKIKPEERDYLYGDDRPIDNNMTEEEAYRLSKWAEGPRYSLFTEFVRDTVQVSILGSKFSSRAYLENREKLELGDFNADSLQFIPFTNGKKRWDLQVLDSISFGGVTGPAILISGTLPFKKFQGASKKTVMTMGSLGTFDHTGSWEKD